MRRQTVRFLFAVVMVSGVLALAGSTAGAQSTCYPNCGGPSVTASTSTAGPGDTVVIRGDGWPVGSSMTVVVNSTPQVLSTFVVTNVDGSFTQSVTIPTNLEAGAHTLTVTGVTPAGETLSYVVTTINVPVAAGAQFPGAQAPGLAFTGSDGTDTLVYLGGVAIAVGAVITVATRRRAGAGA